MAAVDGVMSAHATLSGTTADTVTLSGDGSVLAICNHHATEKLWARFDGTVAVALADETYVILPGQTKVFEGGYANRPVSVVGNGNVYSVETL